MNSLQERVNQAFRNANKATISAPTLTKDQWLQEAWPELQKPQLTHLSQLKRQLVNPHTIRPRQLCRRDAYNRQTNTHGSRISRNLYGISNENESDDEIESEFGKGPYESD